MFHDVCIPPMHKAKWILVIFRNPPRKVKRRNFSIFNLIASDLAISERKSPGPQRVLM